MHIRRTPIIPIKWIPDKFDSDWDGVPNYKDCQPFNPNKQDHDVRRIEYERRVREKMRRDKMSRRRLNVKSSARPRSQIDDSRRNNRYDINKPGTPQNYRNQQYKRTRGD